MPVEPDLEQQQLVVFVGLLSTALALTSLLPLCRLEKQQLQRLIERQTRSFQTVLVEFVAVFSVAHPPSVYFCRKVCRGSPSSSAVHSLPLLLLCSVPQFVFAWLELDSYQCA